MARLTLACVALGALLCVGVASAAFPPSCTGKTNTLPVYDGPLTHVASVANGIKYKVDAVDPPLNVVHVYGTPYEMGFARGTLMKEEINVLMPQVFAYLDGEVRASRARRRSFGDVRCAVVTASLCRPSLSDRFGDQVLAQVVAGGHRQVSCTRTPTPSCTPPITLRR